jgi:sarcosine oxidase delta subunit
MTFEAHFRPQYSARALTATHKPQRHKFTTMKSPYVIKTFGLGSVLALAIGLGSSAFAGPGPQYWAQMEQIRAEMAAKTNAAKAKAATAVEVPAAKPAPAVPAAKPAAAPAMACPHCKSKALEEFSFTNVSGKIAPHSTVIGTSHSCEGCSGVITVARGKVTDEMKRSCPICAKADPNCCSTSNKVASN